MLKDWHGTEVIGEECTVHKLRWFGHVKRKANNHWVKNCISMVVEGMLTKSKHRKTWYEVVVCSDLKVRGLKREDAQDRSYLKVTNEGYFHKLRSGNM